MTKREYDVPGNLSDRVPPRERAVLRAKCALALTLSRLLVVRTLEAACRSKISRILGRPIPLLKMRRATLLSMGSIPRCGFTLARPMTFGSVLWNTSRATARALRVRSEPLRVRVD